MKHRLSRDPIKSTRTVYFDIFFPSDQQIQSSFKVLPLNKTEREWGFTYQVEGGCPLLCQFVQRLHGWLENEDFTLFSL